MTPQTFYLAAATPGGVLRGAAVVGEVEGQLECRFLRSWNCHRMWAAELPQGPEYRQAFPLLALLVRLLCQISGFEVEDKQ